MREHHRLTKEMYEEINKVIAAVARDRGVQVVFYAERESLQTRDTPELLQLIERRKVLYADPSVDMTEEVLTRANEGYRPIKP